MTVSGSGLKTAPFLGDELDGLCRFRRAERCSASLPTTET